MDKPFDGKTAVVTGGARGLGRAMVERLAGEGALVLFNYATSADAARDVVETVAARGGRAVALEAALGDISSIERFAADIRRELGAEGGEEGGPCLDFLVNNIGGGVYGTTLDTTPEVFDHTFSNNVRIPFFLTQNLAASLKDGGRVVNVSSVASRLAGRTFAVYSMSKAALDMYTRILAKELGPRGITVNGVLPGFNATETNERELSDPAVKAQIEKDTLLGRFGEPDDIAGIVHALVSPDCRWITGQCIEASGGFQF